MKIGKRGVKGIHEISFIIIRMEEGENTKIAIVNPDKCKPKKCGQ